MGKTWGGGQEEHGTQTDIYQILRLASSFARQWKWVNRFVTQSDWMWMNLPSGQALEFMDNL